MAIAWQTDVAQRLMLEAETAADLMTVNPISIRADATVGDAVALLTDRGFGGAPVIDEAGHPIGVVSRADIVAHERERERQTITAGDQPAIIQQDTTIVHDIMTPAVFSVAVDLPADKVVAEMLALNVHRVFVVDHDGSLIGVISALDVLRHLSRRASTEW